jgi:hypothetical protein
VAGHLVASLTEAPNLLGGIEQVDARELVMGSASASEAGGCSGYR